jgi:hypothetical protein
MLNLLDQRGEYLADVETTADGSFAFDDARDGASVRAWLEGAVLTLPAVATGVDFDFRTSNWFTVRGHVVDPGGAPLVGCTIDCRDAADGWLASATTDGKGAFRVRLNQKVDHLVVAPDGWRHKVPGPFIADQDVTIDLRQCKEFFLLQGTLRDENRKPVVDAAVTTQDGTDVVARARTDAAGHWALWCNRTASLLWFDAGNVVHNRPGPWRTAQTLDLDWRGEGFVVLTGRVLDAAGRPVARANVIPLTERAVAGHPDEPIATTDATGHFRGLVPPWAKFVAVYVGDDPVFAAGPWRTDATVELRATK